MDLFMTLTQTVLLQLAWTSIQAALLIGLLWLLCRLLPRLPAATRCMLWWLLGAQLLIGLFWQAPVKLPLLSSPQITAPVARSPAPVTSSVHDIWATQTVTTTPASDRITHAAPGAATHLPWREVLMALWLSGLLVQLTVVARQWQKTRRIRRTSRPLDDARLQALCLRQSKQLGLRRYPALRVSDAIDSPQVTGLVHPVVLFPARQTLAPAEQAMALAHELAHVRRGDLWTGWIPILAQWLFFFHPLVRLAMREYALNREAACDGLALRLPHAVPQAYGRLLLRLGVEQPMPAGLAGAASPSFQHLKRRLTMLTQISGGKPRVRDWLLIALIACAGVLPYRVVAASQPTQNTTQHADTTTALASPRPVIPPAPPVPPAPPTPIMPPAPPMPAVPAVPAMPPMPAMPAMPAMPPMPPMPPSPDTYGFHASHMNIDIDSNARYGFALFDGDSLIIHGTSTDTAAMKKLDANHQPMLWFRRGDKTYLSHDPKLIERASDIYAPLTRLSRQQGRLSGRQGALSGRQAGLSAREAAFSRRQARLSQRQAKLSQKQALLAEKAATGQAAADRRALDAQQRAMDAAQQRLEQAHAALEAKLDAKRQALQEQQAALAKQQQALAQRQEQIARDAGQAMNHLLDEAVAKGLAQRISNH
ncbi:MAG TPA: M56 family metallopeptidase [Rhodanobacteraceae bacterium]|nr:M56 family metallopeptidase [Rhodanobacteraceae bacterium]